MTNNWVDERLDRTLERIRPDWMNNPESGEDLDLLRKWKVDPICPECGAVVEGLPSKFGTMHEHCGLRSYNYKPLQTMGTLAARSHAHSAFDPLWKENRMTRREAYEWLAGKMGLQVDACHMSLMSHYQAMQVVALLGYKIESKPFDYGDEGTTV